MVDYKQIYSRMAFIVKRISPEPDQTAKQQLEIVQEYIDDTIEKAIRVKLGDFDQNGFKILLPLTGTVNIVDELHNTVTLKMEKAIQRFADDLVISEYRRDASETVERKETAEKDLVSCLDSIYGITISSVRPDFTTEFLTADAITSEEGVTLISQNEEVIEFQGTNNC